MDIQKEQPTESNNNLDTYLQKAKIALQQELQDLTKKALEYKMKRDGAKTTAKRHYYEKKINKNSLMAYKILATLKDMEG